MSVHLQYRHKHLDLHGNNRGLSISGLDPGGAQGPGPPLATKNEAPAPKFYKIEAPEWQF